jgi:hypothetical protein
MGVDGGLTRGSHRKAWVVYLAYLVYRRAPTSLTTKAAAADDSKTQRHSGGFFLLANRRCRVNHVQPFFDGLLWNWES